jgi:site-specific DNA recombinase
MKKIDTATEVKLVTNQRKKFISAGLYARVSSAEQQENRNIQNQTSSLQKYVDLMAASDGLIKIAAWYLDDGISGTIPLEKRPAGSKLLADAANGKFNVVLVWKLDRLARKPSVALNAIETLEGYGVSVKSITEAFDASTSSGRLMMNMLAGFAGFERDNIVERSIEGTNRRAKEGQWLGGIVPYGYEVVGHKKDARLAISDKSLPKYSLSEADVVRMIYRKLIIENKSCVKIADDLNALGIPPSYTKDNRQLKTTAVEGKRKSNTAGIWRPSRIRNLVVNSVYKGLHIYGKRSKKQRELINRTVLPIVNIQDWERAQQVLISNRILSKRNAKERYLLRGLVKCGLCGLTYTGCTYHTYQGSSKRYYRCNGKTAYRGPTQGHCQSKAINAADLEEAVWNEIEDALINSDTTFEKLNTNYRNQENRLTVIAAEKGLIQKSMISKQGERERMLDLYRHSIITMNDVESQLTIVANEEGALKIRMEELQAATKEQSRIEEKLAGAGELIEELHQILNKPLSWEIKRKVIELLIWEVKVTTVTKDNKRKNEIAVTFAFGENMLAANRRGRGSWLPPA